MPALRLFRHLHIRLGRQSDHRCSHRRRGTVGTTTNTYNGDDQLTDAVVAGGSTTHSDYDPNGSQIDVTVNGTVTATYSYDVRNKMVGYSSGTTGAIYVYDDAGNRVAETTGGVTTYYLTDTQNPTGYAQPVEEHQGSAATAPTETYLIGDRVFGEADSSRRRQLSADRRPRQHAADHQCQRFCDVCHVGVYRLRDGIEL